MASVSLFWNTNMAAVTSCENALEKGLIYALLLFVFIQAQLIIKDGDQHTAVTGDGTPRRYFQREKKVRGIFKNDR